ncbi:23S rRNA (pseudouridine(1915)-N(3))-methyltransferase RlmH [Culicoidibacter larvae]|uniref:Ribosomal RNA large subunit methyltransferase H n=1 Tax=Culicoidibacter larvae TaxID=2579976 RepID=A0A5R8QJ39_9FIRM|nr:23S rRNA (pseudouridine(1915)-N(3))-methyltransferase RlmH [Culicoidibacter larvae]TLG77463.1 23S rRNA (pseudouridine(1915)-N(3))-methyltransferase RlmH [Culicoidibacter larvae]
MQIQIIAVGKLKEKYLQMAMSEYLKRMSAYAKMQVVEIAEAKVSENGREADILAAKQKEGDMILAKINNDVHVIALAIEGKQCSSEAFAASLDQLATYGKSKVAFIIGGSHGLADTVYQRANQLLSFSEMTFPHQLMRVFLIEQIYRGFKINMNEPYHK